MNRSMAKQKRSSSNEVWALAGLLVGRFGTLALSHAAGRAAAAEKLGNCESKKIWDEVVIYLRTSIAGS